MSAPDPHEVVLPGDAPAAGARRGWPLALAAAGIALAILGTLPERSWSWTDWRPAPSTLAAAQDGAFLALAFGALVAMAFTILALWIGRRGIAKGRKKKDEGEPSLKDRLLLAAMVAASLVLALLLLLLHPWDLGLDLGFWSITEPATPNEAEIEDAATGFASELGAGVPEWIASLLYAVFAVGLVATAVAAAILAVEQVRQRMAQRAARARRERVAREVAAAAGETIDDLTRPGGDARAAIIRCYARFERSLALAETPRAPAQTAMEFMRTALAALPLGAADVASLTRLFEIARFSRHPLGEDERDAAWAALVSIRRALAGRTSDAPRR